MAKQLLILLLPVALTSCSIGHVNLPMSLGPSDPAPASCLTCSGTPSYGDCKGASTVPIPARRTRLNDRSYPVGFGLRLGYPPLVPVGKPYQVRLPQLL